MNKASYLELAGITSYDEEKDKRHRLNVSGQKNYGGVDSEEECLKNFDFSLMEEYFPNIKLGKKKFCGKQTFLSYSIQLNK